MKRFLSIALLFLIVPLAGAQTGAMLEKADQKMTRSKWGEAVDLYAKAEKIWQQGEDAQLLFHALDSLARASENLGKYDSAFAQKVRLFRTIPDHQKNEEYLRYTLTELVRLEDSIKSRNIIYPFFPGTELFKNKLYYPVSSVLKVSGDTFIVRIEAGSNMGIHPNSTGGLLTRYTPEDTAADRGNEEFGNCTLIELKPNYSVVKLIRFRKASASGLSVRTGDNLMMETWLPWTTNDRSDLIKCAEINVLFYDNESNPLYDLTTLLSLADYPSQAKIMSVMAEQVRGTAEWLYDPDEEHENVSSGAFAGTNFWEAMLRCNTSDIRAFLRFVRSYPGRYMGINYKINETWATWVINFTPDGDDEVKSLYKLMVLGTTVFKNENDFVIQNERYLRRIKDSLNQWIDLLPEANSDEEKQEQLRKCKWMLAAAEKVDATSTYPAIMYAVGWAYDQAGYTDTAKMFCQRLIDDDISPANGYFLLFYLNYDHKKYFESLANADSLIAINDTIGFYHVQRAWALIHNGRIREAEIAGYEAMKWAPYLRNAHFTLSFVHLAQHRMDSAYKYAKSGMPLIEEQFYLDSSILKELDAFVEYNYNPEGVRKIRKFIVSEWNRYYKHTAMSTKYVNEGADLYYDEEYDSAFIRFEKAMNHELQLDTLRHSDIHNIAEWLGLDLYKNKKYSEAIQYFEKAWNLSSDVLDDRSDELWDLSYLASSHELAGDASDARYYWDLHAVLTKKAGASSLSKNLFVIAVGDNNGPGYKYRKCEKDAQTILDLYQAQEGLLYDTIHSYAVIGEKCSEKALDDALGNILTQAKPGDQVVFYVAAESGSLDDKPFFIAGGDTIDFELTSLRLFSNAATHNVMIFDVLNVGFTKFIADRFGKSEALDLSSVLVIEPKRSRVEHNKGENGKLVEEFSKAFRGEANVMVNDPFTSATELNAFLISHLGQDYAEISTVSYFNGTDFNMSQSGWNRSLSLHDTTPPMIQVQVESGSSDAEGMRGGKTKSTGSSIVVSGQVLDASGVASLKINNREVKLSDNGRFLETVRSTEKLLILTATDQENNIGVDSVYLSFNEQRKGGIASKQRRSYAIMIATDDYEDDEWSDLKNPVRDARAIGAILENQYGYEVEYVINKTKDEIQDVLFKYITKSYGEEDQLFVFIAGHGHYDKFYQSMIVTKDSKSDDPKYSSYLSYYYIRENLNNIRDCNNVMLVLDVCFGGTVFDKTLPPRYMDSDIENMKKREFIEKMRKTSTRLYITSGDSTYVPDGSGEHSPFAGKFIETLIWGGGGRGFVSHADFASFYGRLDPSPKSGYFGNYHGGDFLFVLQSEEGGNLKQRTASVAPK